RLVHLDGEAEEETEVALHLAVAADELARVPVLGPEGSADEFGVGKSRPGSPTTKRPWRRALERPRKTSSEGCTSWRPSGRAPRSFRAISRKGRFRKDIRESFRGGPTATEARLAVLIRPGREASTPLKTLCPRPSHRLAILKTALKMEGVLRGWP